VTCSDRSIFHELFFAWEIIDSFVRFTFGFGTHEKWYLISDMYELTCDSESECWTISSWSLPSSSLIDIFLNLGAGSSLRFYTQKHDRKSQVVEHFFTRISIISGCLRFANYVFKQDCTRSTRTLNEGIFGIEALIPNRRPLNANVSNPSWPASNIWLRFAAAFGQGGGSSSLSFLLVDWS